MAQGGEGRRGDSRTIRSTEGHHGDGDFGPIELDGGYDGSNTTGFVSPAGDALEGPIDLSLLLDLRRPHRYPVRVLGEALVERGILPGDILIADTATAPKHGRVAIVMLHGEVWVAQLAFRGGQWWMRPSQSGRPLIALDGDGAEVWAVVAALVRPRV